MIGGGSMFRIDVEWEDNPRVRDPLLKSTWARIEIYARDKTDLICLTDCLSETSRSRRKGVHGSAFPLACWIVENWWLLLHESTRIDRYRGGRAAQGKPELRPWIARHNFLTARNGFALPDLTLYRDGEMIALRAASDPWGLLSDFPVQFVTDRELRLQPDSVAEGLRSFVEAVADRVRESNAREIPEAIEWLTNWEAIQGSSREEAMLCETAARMGLDPYDPSELPDRLVELIESSFPPLSPMLQVDLAEIASGTSLAADLEWIHKVSDQVGDEMSMATALLPKAEDSGPAFSEGYRKARLLRDQLDLPEVLADVQEFIGSRFGWEPEPIVVAPTNGVAERIKAIIGTGHDRVRIAIPSPMSQPTSRRFLLARAIFMARGSVISSPRLLTGASSWWQRASRAFAAEFLAPAEALVRRVGPQVTYDRLEALAGEFNVSSIIIRHQIVNHKLAEIIDL